VISKRLCFSLFFLIIGISGPVLLQYYTIPLLVETFEDGYTIGVIFDLTSVKPLNTIYDLADGWTVVDQGNERYLEKTVSYTQDNLPHGIEFNLATTEKHESGVEFRQFIISNLGWLGPFPESFVVFGNFSSIVFSVMGGIQTFLLILKSTKSEEKIMYFYEMHYVVIHHIKNSIFFKEKIIRKSHFLLN